MTLCVDGMLSVRRHVSIIETEDRSTAKYYKYYVLRTHLMMATSMTDQEILNSALMSIPSRSERNEQAVLVSTFVEAGTLFRRLSSVDNQIIYGRRGTGKTHTLHYLASERTNQDHLSIYCDLNALGSATSVYADTTLSLPQRATTLLRDLLVTLHEELRRAILKDAQRLEFHACSQGLSDLLDQINEVQVVGETETTNQHDERRRTAEKLGASAALTPTSVKLGASAEQSTEAENKQATTIRQKGIASYHIKFGGVNAAFRTLANALPIRRVWVLLDEWSSVPLDLQPYLADLLRRCLFNIPKLIVKIAALEYRSNFRISTGQGTYIGLEVGAEMTSIVNVDDYLVFDNDESKARDFYTALFAKHVKASGTLTERLAKFTSDQLVNAIFTQRNAFDELVMAAEGVPRDAINIASLAAQQADDRKLSIPYVKKAARQWFLNAKRAAVDDPTLQALLNWIVDRVIGERKARAFLVKTGTKSERIDALFDSRVLHVSKRDISQPDGSASPARYDAFKLDYGCYVHLMATRQLSSTTGSDGEDYVAVPADDYRAVRRAVLDVAEFEASLPGTQN